MAGSSTGLWAGLWAFHIVSSCGDTLGFHMGWQLDPQSKCAKKLGESCIPFYDLASEAISVFSAVIVREGTTEPRSLQSQWDLELWDAEGADTLGQHSGLRFPSCPTCNFRSVSHHLPLGH